MTGFCVAFSRFLTVLYRGGRGARVKWYPPLPVLVTLNLTRLPMEKPNPFLAAKLARMKEQRDNLQAKIDKMEKKYFPPLPKAPVVKEYALRRSEPKVWVKANTSFDFTIEFDGGTSCNIPSKGFGEGYGSFQINDGEIKRVTFGKGHSCNSAEIRTMVAALEELASMCNPAQSSILIRGDSQIALKWVTCGKQPKASHSEGFRDAIERLRRVIQLNRWRSVSTEWRGRAHSVKLFGH